MRIGIDARFYGTVGKGLGRYTERLVSELEKIDTINQYFIFLCPDNFDEYTPQGKNFSKVLSRSRWYSFSEQCIFPWLLLKYRLDFVHFPHFNVPLLYRKKFLMTLHDLILFHHPTERGSTRQAYVYWVKFVLYRLVLSSALKRAKRIITVSEFTRKDIIHNYPRVEEKIVVTKESAESFCHYQNVSESQEKMDEILMKNVQKKGENSAILKPYYLYVGNAYPHKNLEIFLTIATHFPERTFVLVGKEDYFYQRLEALSKERSIANIVFAGYVSDTDLALLYRYALGYIFPSFYEGFGLPPLEAMLYGSPVIASNRGSLPEILGDAALYFDPHSYDELKSQIQKIESDETLRKALIEKGYQQVQKYSWKKMAKETHTVYKELKMK